MGQNCRFLNKSICTMKVSIGVPRSVNLNLKPSYTNFPFSYRILSLFVVLLENQSSYGPEKPWYNLYLKFTIAMNIGKFRKKKFAFLSFYALTKVPIEYFYVVIVGTWCVSKFHALLISRALEKEIKKNCRKWQIICIHFCI